MRNIHFIGDPHFNHTNIIIYSHRPFIKTGDLVDNKKWVSKEIATERCREMNELMIKNWNAQIKKNDLIYVLGDFIFGNWRAILPRLNGKIFLILGSHDGNALDYQEHLYDLKRLYEYKDNKADITLCHYAMRVWPRSHFNSWHLYGHSHGHLEPFGKSFDVGVDVHDFKPWSLEEVKEKMKTLPDNFNLVKKELINNAPVA